MNLRGMFVPNVTPFDFNGEIEDAMLRSSGFLGQRRCGRIGAVRKHR